MTDYGRPVEAGGEGMGEGDGARDRGITRRSVLRIAGTTISIAALPACRRPVEHIVPYVEPPERTIPGIPKTFATTLPTESGAIGVLVETHEGRPTKIEGNPMHPGSRGGTSAAVQASILDLYDPDRMGGVRHGGKSASWKDFEAEIAALVDGSRHPKGRGLGVWVRPAAGPTRERLERAFRERYPEAAWVSWSPAGEGARARPLDSPGGGAARPVYHLEAARVVVALDADLLQTDPEAVRHAAAWAAGRDPGDSMSTWFVAEPRWTPTGAVADRHAFVRRSRIGGLLVLLARELTAMGVRLRMSRVADAPWMSELDRSWARSAAKSLAQHRGQGLVAAGPQQPDAVHEAVALLNSALENDGRTVTWARAAATDGIEALSQWVEAARGGSFETVIVLGGNPAWDAPREFDLAGALEKVPTVIHHAVAPNETSSLAGWFLPESHPFEAWSDARSAEGVPSVVQPLLRPLFEGRSTDSVIGALVGEASEDGYELVRTTWQEILEGGDFESRWDRCLHDGLAPEAIPASVRPRAAGGGAFVDLANSLPKEAAAEWEATIDLSRTVGDGSLGNNAWLQELPDPITKTTWGNVVTIGEDDAAKLGVATGDVVAVEADGATVEGPAWVAPGQAPGVLGLTVGYGRGAGTISAGVGFDVQPLRRADAPGWRAAAVRATGATVDVASTQDHGSMEGRPMALEVSRSELAAHPDAVHERLPEHPPLKALWDEHSYEKGLQWGMTIDLNRCTGCSACVVACQAENNIPVVGKDQVERGREMQWLRIDRYFTEPTPGASGVAFQPLLCMHCENAPCEQVCPVAATVHDEEGLNVMVYNRCIGTRYCSNNCPYKVRRFNFYNFTKDVPEVRKMAANPDVTVRSRGVMEKCTYCTQRINAARIEARVAGVAVADGDVVTACQQACPTDAIEFGSVTDPDSRVVAKKKDPRNYDLLGELYTRPRTSYLARVRNADDEESA